MRTCVYCDSEATHPRLPLCVDCDIRRLREGVSADEVMAMVRRREREARTASALATEAKRG